MSLAAIYDKTTILFSTTWVVDYRPIYGVCSWILWTSDRRGLHFKIKEVKKYLLWFPVSIISVLGSSVGFAFFMDNHTPERSTPLLIDYRSLVVSFVVGNQNISAYSVSFGLQIVLPTDNFNYHIKRFLLTGSVLAYCRLYYAHDSTIREWIYA